LFRSERNGNSGAKRLAPQHDTSRRIARGSEVVGRHGIIDQAGLAWLSCRAAIAAIGQCHKSGAVCRQPFESPGTQIEGAGIALKIGHDGSGSVRRHMPGDQLFAIGGGQDHLIGLRQARDGWRCTPGIREIQ
jgi:hypothetical protein